MRALLVAALVAAPILAGAHPNDVPDPGFYITSDFGPRDAGGNASRFHRSIDYRRHVGRAVPLLEDGTVTEINRPNTMVSLVVVGVHTFRYLHFFDDTALPIVAGSFVLARSSDNNLAIVRMSGVAGRASYIISPTANRTVTISTARPGLPPVPFVFMTADGMAQARTINAVTVAANPDAGPAGGSGGFAVHMHVDHGLVAGTNTQVSMNPLLHIADRESRFIAFLRDRTDIGRVAGYAVGPLDTTSTFLKLRVNSEPEPNDAAENSTIAKDLESVKLYVDQVDPAHLIREWSYGGKTDPHDPVNTDITDPTLQSNGTSNGVQTHFAGAESFVWNDWDSASTPAGIRPSDLPEGAHDFLFVLRDVRDNIPFADGQDVRFRFTVDRTPPTSVIQVKKTP